MSLINRFLLKELIYYTLIFSVLFVGLVWLVQSLRFMEMIVSYDVQIWTYFQFVGYLVPDLLTTTLPIASCLAAIIVLTKFKNHSEMKAFFSLRMGPGTLSKPFVIWGGTLVFLSIFINIYIVPPAFKAFRDLGYDLKSQFTASLIKPGRFNTIQNMTIYVKERNQEADLKGILVHGIPLNGGEPYVITAQRGGVLSESKESSKRVFLNLFNGNYFQKHQQETVFMFDQLSINLSSYFHQIAPREIKPYERSLKELLGVPTSCNAQSKRFYAEGHQRLAIPLLNITNAFMAAIWLIPSTVSRSYGMLSAFYFVSCLLIQGLTLVLINLYPIHSMFLWMAYGIFLVITFIYGVWYRMRY